MKRHSSRSEVYLNLATSSLRSESSSSPAPSSSRGGRSSCSRQQQRQQSDPQGGSRTEILCQSIRDTWCGRKATAVKPECSSIRPYSQRFVTKKRVIYESDLARAEALVSRLLFLPRGTGRPRTRCDVNNARLSMCDSTSREVPNARSFDTTSCNQHDQPLPFQGGSEEQMFS